MPGTYSPAGPYILTPLGKKVHRASEIGGNISTDLIFDAIGDGRFYSGGHTFLGVLDNATVQFLITTPAPNGRGAARFYVSVGGDSLVTYTKGVTTTADGTAVPLVNHNDNSTNTTSFTATHTPTSPTGGTEQITDFPVFGGSRVSATGEDAIDAAFRVLAPDTKYLIAVTNVSGAAITIFIGAFGVEFEV